MTSKKNIRISIPQTFDEPDDNETNERRHSQQSASGSGIPLFKSFSISDIWNRDAAEDENTRARIPSIISSSGEVYYASPLPKLSMVVLSIAMLSEFLSASVAGPFILFMVKGYGVFEEDSEVAFWTGILVSVFFLAQFLTSLLWATLAEKSSPRAVLSLCLLGSALSTLVFGASDSLWVAMVSRLAQGVFAGSIGVAKSSIGAITDSSNEGKAYAILGFCWGLGGIAGGVVGGTFEHPAAKWPEIFGETSLFSDLPYLLPCLIAATFMLTGSFLACFLGPDLGPSDGRGFLNPEKVIVPLPSEDDRDGRRSVGSIKYLAKRVSTMFKNPFIPETEERASLLFSQLPASSTQSPLVPSFQLPTSVPQNYSYSAIIRPGGYPLDRNQTMTVDSTRSRGSRRYSSFGRRSARNANLAGIRRASKGDRNSNRFSRVSYYGDNENAPEELGSRAPPSPAVRRTSLVDRVVMANENAFAGGIADFWVAAAISLEGSDDVAQDEDDIDVPENENEGEDNRGREYDSRSINSRRSISVQRPSRIPSRPFFGRQTSETRLSIPTSPVVARAQLYDPTERTFPRTDTIDSANNLRAEPALRPIIESRRVSTFYPPVEDVVDSVEEEKGPPRMEIPVLVIMQYGFLALHATTHDQVFMSYLVTPYEGGGLGLNAGDFAQLIALMSFFQIFYQFYLYPNIGYAFIQDPAARSRKLTVLLRADLRGDPSPT
ncbi:hypothetical protein PQX77_011900 [Marasmius sp. AFHP31]|nr:hypothetical protein PQX77_011900 [Marasmius sp. AFHP31]